MMFKRSLSCAAMVAGMMILLTGGSGILISFLAKDSSEKMASPSPDPSSPSFTQLQSFGQQSGHAWYATVQRSITSPGAFQGPSELLRVDGQNVTSTILVDPQPITSVVVSKDGKRLVYRTIDGKLVALRDQQLIDLPSGYTPISWIDAKTLLVSQGNESFRISLDTPERVMTVPSTSTRPL